MRHKFGQTMLLATLSTNSATATDGIDAEWKTVFLCPCGHHKQCGSALVNHVPCYETGLQHLHKGNGRSARVQRKHHMQELSI